MELPLTLELDTLRSRLLCKVVFGRIQKVHLREHGAFQSSNLKLVFENCKFFFVFRTRMIFERNWNRKEIRIIISPLLEEFLV